MIAKALQRLAVPVGDLTPHPRNDHHQGDVGAICQSLERFGQVRPIVVQKSTGYVVAGNHVLAAARALGWPKVARVAVDLTDQEAVAYLVADNRIAQLGTFDDQGVADLLADLAGDGGLEGTGYDGEDLDRLLDDLARNADNAPPATPSLADRFLVPPFSVLDARSGWWRERKRSWRDWGVPASDGRDDGLLNEGVQKNDPAFYAKKRAVERREGRTLTTAEFLALGLWDAPEGDTLAATGTSGFDPVLAELIVRWFSAPDDSILDPLAGGACRGLVSTALGRRYVGVDLRPDQVAGNEAIAREVMGAGAGDPGTAALPEWIAGDSAGLDDLLPQDDGYDLVMTCPPYFDLERYGGGEGDLSEMGDEDFRAAYAAILAAAVGRLRDDRFACVVVGEVRDRAGHVRGLIPATIAAMEAAGARYYNEAVIITPLASAATMAARPFEATRVVVRVHQSVLVFVKGDRHAAASRLGGSVDMGHALDALDDRWLAVGAG